MRFKGVVGYAIPTDVGYGVIEDNIIEKSYKGEVLRNNTRWSRGDGVNDNLTMSNQISILADEFAYANFQNIKYIVWQGAKWRIDSIEVRHPRLLIQLGGVYNGPGRSNNSGMSSCDVHTTNQML